MNIIHRRCAILLKRWLQEGHEGLLSVQLSAAFESASVMCRANEGSP